MALKHSPLKDASSEEDESSSDPLKEIDHLRNQLLERDAHIAMIEDDYTKCNAQLSDMERQLMVWREKYDRLYDSHKRVQKINQNLEDKLLQMADKCSIDKSQLARDIEILSLRLAESNHNIGSLQKENERYKNDMNLAIQLLQCKPDHFVSQKFDSLPIETQARVSSYIMSKAKNDLSPSPTTGKGKSVTTPEKIDHQEFEFNISASLMSKILEESVQNTISKHCDTCTCLKKSLNPFSNKDNKMSVSVQTINKTNIFCPNCNPSPLPNNRPPVPTPLSPLTPITPITPLTPSNNIPMEITEIMEVKNIPEKKVPMPSPSISMKQTSSDSTMSVPVHNSPNHGMVKPMPSRPSEESTKLISLKHKEIMDKIGDNLNEMNSKHDFNKLTSMEPATGHHRLCDLRTSTNNNSKMEETIANHNKPIDVDTSCKPVLHSPKLVSTIQMADDIDVSFAQIENTASIPNTIDTRHQTINNIPKSKSDLNYVDTPKTFHNSSISSNEAESKTSSSRSWKNNGSYSGSNNKVHIGPGPRFCSLRMQAGSKNILLDNAQPNIAPVLYTRTRNYDTTPLIDGELSLLNDNSNKKEMSANNKVSYHGHINQINNNRNVYSNTSTSNEEIIPILDLPNEDLPLSKPIQVCEKPESGYKSNDSAEIIDKLLFGMDTVIQDGVKEAPLNTTDNKNVLLNKTNLNDVNEKGPLDINKEKSPINNFKSNSLDANRAETVKQDRREALQNMKVFNFDQYERSAFRLHPANKMFPSHKIMVPNFTYGTGKVPGGAQLILPEKKEVILDDVTSPMAIAGGDNNLSKSTVSVDGNKKYVRNIANQTQPEQVTNRESGGGEKSSSSLSSDDSAAVLQKQQLIRVAEWVQKNLEMEHQLDLENSDSCQQSVEELHHVRNDFPRPAKVDHRTRKASLKAGHKSSHHSSKHAIAPKPEEVVVCEKEKTNEEAEGKVSMVMSSWEADTVGGSRSTVTSYTTRSYSREELARMEYNVKQFLLNGTRWTSLDSPTPKDMRTSSKTETDL